ncbi:hypothetical protein C0J52_24262 [Blattella germanica]|nr:hypothetical protein C0J52_24262 [Blattella germanica]
MKVPTSEKLQMELMIDIKNIEREERERERERERDRERHRETEKERSYETAQKLNIYSFDPTVNGVEEKMKMSTVRNVIRNWSLYKAKKMNH